MRSPVNVPGPRPHTTVVDIGEADAGRGQRLVHALKQAPAPAAAVGDRPRAAERRAGAVDDRSRRRGLEVSSARITTSPRPVRPRHRPRPSTSPIPPAARARRRAPPRTRRRRAASRPRLSGVRWLSSTSTSAAGSSAAPASGHSTKRQRRRRRGSRPRRTGHVGARAQAVEVEVVQAQAARALVALGERERGARHDALDAERAQDLAHERGLAGAELAAQRHERGRHRAARRAGGERAGRVRRGERGGEHASEEAELLGRSAARRGVAGRAAGAAAAAPVDCSGGALGQRRGARDGRRSSPGAPRRAPAAPPSRASGERQAEHLGQAQKVLLERLEHGRRVQRRRRVEDRDTGRARGRRAALRWAMPCTRVMPAGLPDSSLVEKLPSVHTTRGAMSSTWRSR